MDDSYLDAKWRQRFRRRLLAWYRRQGRDLPWRRTRDPYAIWISEIMLQQTQVETVKPYYARFLKAFPNVKKLATAKESQVLRLWEGLGYYRRARQLHAAAQQIAENYSGKFPTSFEDVLGLPGIGRYTAGAVLSFSHDARLPVVEANTLRLYCRLMALRDDPRRREGQAMLWEFAESVLPRAHCGEMNQALIELGSQICRPQDPNCKVCPVADCCAARKEDCVEEVPMKAQKVKYESITESAVVIRRRGRVLLRQCQSGERWAGLWDFPRVRVDSNSFAAQKREVTAAVSEQIGQTVCLGEMLTQMDHAVTRFRITLFCFHGQLVVGARMPATKTRKWVAVDDLDAMPLSVTGRKISRLIEH